MDDPKGHIFRIVYTVLL